MRYYRLVNMTFWKKSKKCLTWLVSLNTQGIWKSFHSLFDIFGRPILFLNVHYEFWLDLIVFCVCAHMRVHGFTCVLKVCDVSSPGCLMWGDRDQRGKNGFTALRMWQPLSSAWHWVDTTKCSMKTRPRWTTTLRQHTPDHLDSMHTHIMTFSGKLT